MSGLLCRSALAMIVQPAVGMTQNSKYTSTIFDIENVLSITGNEKTVFISRSEKS